MSVDALVFDAYGTLYDVHSVMRRCETCFPGKGAQLSQLWRAKQLEYTWQRSLMRRYVPFSTVTREALEYACAALGVDCGDHVHALMAEYLALAPFPEVPKALSRLTMKKAILSNGSPDLLEPLVRNSGLRFDAVLSVAFVSSNCWDALGAKSYGFRVYWINRVGAPLDRLGFAPDAEVKSLTELADEVLR
jgi:2-haloacid dehalogenase